MLHVDDVLSAIYSYTVTSSILEDYGFLEWFFLGNILTPLVTVCCKNMVVVHYFNTD